MIQILFGIFVLGVGGTLMWLGGQIATEGWNNLKTGKTTGQFQFNDPINKPVLISNDISEKSKLMGIMLEGRRNNIISYDCANYITSLLPKKSIVRNSKIAPSFSENVININPNEVISITFAGMPKISRKDYTFSFMIYSDTGDINSFDLNYSISDKEENSSSNYDFHKVKDYTEIKKSGIKYYRPQISHYFSSAPTEVTGKIILKNKSKKVEKIAIIFPVIEEGLFASSPILSGEFRAASFLSYDFEKDLLNKIANGITVSFLFRPSWSANRLTPGIDPCLLYWTTPDYKNGIKIIADSEDNGRIKLLSLRDGSVSTILSDITPVGGRIYSFDFRIKKNIADLIINGRNISSTQSLLIPNFNKYSQKIYVGCEPNSDDNSAFGLFRDFRIYEEWLDDYTIKNELQKYSPEIFSYLQH